MSAYGCEPGPWVVAHRGGAGLGPANTLAACARSSALGVRHLEVDLRATADAVCVALQDADLRRVAGVRAAVGDLTCAELRDLPLRGEGRVPRLEHLLAAHPGQLRFGRVPVFARRLVAMAHELGARVLVWTVDDPADMRRLLEAGVDGLVTDRPDLARDTLIARGGWRAPAPAPQARATGPAPGPRTPAPNGA